MTVHQSSGTKSSAEQLLADYRAMKARPGGTVEQPEFFIAEGKFIVQRLLLSCHRVRSVIVQQGRPLSALGPIPANVPVLELSKSEIQEISGFDFHRGYLASADREPLKTVQAFEPDRVSLGLFGITDMENMGTLLRTAAGLGIRQVVFDKASADPFSRRVIRVSMGATLALRLMRCQDVIDDLQTIHAQGVQTIAAAIGPDTLPLDQIDVDEQPKLILLGNEAQGLSPRVQQACQQRVQIGMSPLELNPSTGELAVDSFNVAVAGGIMMHWLTRSNNQRD